MKNFPSSDTLTPLTVAAGVPCFNADKYIGRVLESLYKQTRPPEKIYFVDDGCTDRSPQIAKAFPGIQLLAHPCNLGLAAGRNTLIHHVTEDILVTIDSDAAADPRMIEELLKGLEDPKVAGVGGRSVEVHQTNAADIWRGSHQFSQDWGGEYLRDVWFAYGICSAYRVSALREVGGFHLGHTTNGEDVEMGARLRSRGYRIHYNPEAVVFHERRDTFESLMRMVFRYCKGGLTGLMRNRMEGLGFGLRCTARHLKQNIQRDLLDRGDLQQLFISLCAAVPELAGYCAAAWDMGKIRR